MNIFSKTDYERESKHNKVVTPRKASQITDDEIFYNFKKFQARMSHRTTTNLHYQKTILIQRQRDRSAYQKNPEKYRLMNREIRQKRKKKCLMYYSNGTLTCECCGESIYEFLTIDHINGKGHQHRLKIGGGSATTQYHWLIQHEFPLGYRVLCFNCNCGRSVNGGICPHKIKKEIVLQN